MITALRKTTQVLLNAVYTKTFGTTFQGFQYNQQRQIYRQAIKKSLGNNYIRLNKRLRLFVIFYISQHVKHTAKSTINNSLNC